MSDVHAAAAIIERDGRVFCARRATSGAGQGGWEFPGGKVEDGESPEQAVRREVREELGVSLSTTWLLDTIEHDYPTFHLTMDCLVCALPPDAEPTLSEHEEARWLTRDELLLPAWLPADERVARLLGTYWDQIFATSHL